MSGLDPVALFGPLVLLLPMVLGTVLTAIGLALWHLRGARRERRRALFALILLVVGGVAGVGASYLFSRELGPTASGVMLICVLVANIVAGDTVPEGEAFGVSLYLAGLLLGIAGIVGGAVLGTVPAVLALVASLAWFGGGGAVLMLVGLMRTAETHHSSEG
ncbi:MAG: hypothetical protein EP330_17935 [Deltaproteobacteria bacterium]|nr:MAG: hypothetical protein EP330_17935 [Deltaproteobacteria bacterium]